MFADALLTVMSSLCASILGLNIILFDLLINV